MPLLVTASTTLACIDRAGRPQALPEWLVVPG
jgi:acyl-CoA thioesterase FadM